MEKQKENMKIFLSAAAIVAWLIEAALIFATGPFYRLVKIALTPLLATLVQGHRRSPHWPGRDQWVFEEGGLPGAFCCFDGESRCANPFLGVALRTMTLGAGLAVAGGIVIQLVLRSFFAFFCIANEKATSIKSANRPREHGPHAGEMTREVEGMTFVME